jgi:hypothetical protein
MVRDTIKSPLWWSIGSVGVIAVSVVALSYWHHYQEQAVAQAGAMPVSAVTPLNGFAPTATDPWERALEFGWAAAVATQTAETEAEWRRVGDLWMQAIVELERVSQTSPQKVKTRARVQQYLANFEYAKSEQSKARLSEFEP